MSAFRFTIYEVLEAYFLGVPVEICDAMYFELKPIGCWLTHPLITECVA